MIRVGGRPRTAQKKELELQFFSRKPFDSIFCDFVLNNQHDVGILIYLHAIKGTQF